ncbi:MAG: hypothetical protein AAFS10_23270, partial [Myxococcota bacterium]
LRAAPWGGPEQRWTTGPMAPCIVFTEPGAIAVNATLYIALLCARSPSPRSLELVALNRDDGVWDHRSMLVEPNTVVPGLDDPYNGFNGPDMVLDEQGRPRLLAVPVRSGNGSYGGCVAFDLDLETGTASDPIVVAEPGGGAGIFQSGPCTYAPGSRLGVITGDVYLQGVQFRLHATGRVLE